jgi:hypothetical protein
MIVQLICHVFLNQIDWPFSDEYTHVKWSLGHLPFDLDSLDGDISLKLTHELQKRKRRKNRTAFSAQQIYALEKRFTHQRYLTPNDRDQIANELQLSPAQVITVRRRTRTRHVNVHSWNECLLLLYLVVSKSSCKTQTWLWRTEKWCERRKKTTSHGRRCRF